MKDNNEAPILSSDVLEKLQELLSHCTEREREVLCIRYGLDDGQPKTLEQTGEYFGISPERVRQIETKVARRHTCVRRATRIKDFYC